MCTTITQWQQTEEKSHGDNMRVMHSCWGNGM